MTSRAAYQRVGTHEVVRGEVAEDLVMAQRFLQAGFKVRMWWAEELIQTRMYTGFRHLVEGWSKNLYLGSRASFPGQPLLQVLAPLLILVPQVFWLIPPAALATGADWAAGAVALSVIFWAILAAVLRIPVWYGLLYPLGGLMLGYLMLRSVVRGRRRVEWRGRTYTVEDGRRETKAVEEGNEER
jgi:hypothetical protein